MQRELAPKSKDKTKDPFMPWKQISKISMEILDKMTAQIFSIQNFTRVGKTAMDASAELRRTEEYILNQFLRTQIGMFHPGISAAIIRDFGAVSTDAVTRLTKQQTDLLHIYVDSLLEILNQST